MSRKGKKAVEQPASTDGSCCLFHSTGGSLRLECGGDECPEGHRVSPSLSLVFFGDSEYPLGYMQGRGAA